MLSSFLEPILEKLRIETPQEKHEIANALKKLQEIKQIPIEQLKNSVFLEKLLIDFGLHPSVHPKTGSYEWPDSLSPYIGKGMRIWQYPIQFNQYLLFLSQFQIKNYLEIGIAYGGSFIFAYEYLKRMNPSVHAYCVEVQSPSNLVKAYMKHSKITYIQTKSSNLFNKIDPATKFDLIFIDGDHSKDAVLNDFLLLKNHGDIIAFHDIVDFNCPGVREVWAIVKEQYRSEYDFFEFIDQYKELTQKNNGQFLGIGIAVRKEKFTNTI